jgi:2-dehydro-3-deoxyphosphogluconate aldolase/(4S)-4-hydroxy-2-oxoglutarate aldolase
MSDRPALPIGITRGGVVAIGRRLDAAAVPTIAKALAEGGVEAFEVTLDEPIGEAIEALEAAARVAAAAPLVVGAGTVLSIEAATRALAAGATFLVMPHTDPMLVAWAAERGIPTFPGAATPTEVLEGWRAGAAAIKVFPAASLGPAFLREMRGPLPHVPLLPTGGVTVENLAGFIEVGAIAVGIGSWLFAGGSPSSIEERARQAVSAVAAARPAGTG